MRTQHVALVLAGVVVLGIASAVPAQSATDAHVDDKQSEIDSLRNYEPTPEQEAQNAAMLAEERRRIAYEDIAVPTISPGLAISDDGSVTLRVYEGVDVATVEAALALNGLEASVVTSRYTRADNEALSAALRDIHLEGDEAFGFGYDAKKDIVTVGGSVPASKVRAAVGDRLPYEFQPGVASRVAG